MYEYGDPGVCFHIIECRKAFICPKVVVGAGREGECEWVRSEWFLESMSARERRKEMNVKGAISSWSVVSFVWSSMVGARTRDTALSFGASAGSGERNFDAGDRAGDGAGDAISPLSS